MTPLLWMSIFCPPYILDSRSRSGTSQQMDHPHQELLEPDIAHQAEPPTSSLVVSTFAGQCLNACRLEWEKAATHEFVRQLIDGSLEKEIFRFYQMQDARYLEAYADTCSILSTRFVDPADKLWFIDGARLAILVEQELHTGYGRQLGYGPSEVAALTLTPNNRAYQNHMMVAAQRAPLVEALAALSPCPWLYTDIGMRILNNPTVSDGSGGIRDDHPYADWLRTYADPSFVSYTSDLLGLLDRVSEGITAEEQERAIEAFRASIRYEWMFWEQALTKQEWPI